MIWSTLILVVGCLLASADDPCTKRFYDQDSFVCVCDKNGCDEIKQLGSFDNDQVYVYSTSLKNDRLTQSFKSFQPKTGKNIRTVIDTSKHYQTVLGFGGAITDSVVIVRNQVKAINESMADLLHRHYYDAKGLQYTIGRVPLGSCDFSEREYSFLETPDDFHLKNFKLDDIKIDYLQKVVKDVPHMNFYASPWSSPGWMKTTGKMSGPGMLIGPFNRRYYLAYARYIIRFFEEYYKLGVKFWGLTIQNEPDTGALDIYPFQTLYMSSQMQRDFANLRLGPMMKNNWVTQNIKIMGGDGWRNVTMDACEVIYNLNNDSSAVPGDYVSGLATHWYVTTTPFSVLSEVHKLRPDKFILATEACNSFQPWEQIPYYGKWLSAELYAHDIIQNLRNWVIGWTDWNLWLDTWGGPNWVGNFVDAPILVNITNNQIEFYKQPMYYALGHFSKFIPPNSTIVDLNIDGFDGGDEDDLLEGVAAVTPDNNVVLVLQNRDTDYTYSLEIEDLNHNGRAIFLDVEPKSIKTLIWKLK